MTVMVKMMMIRETFSSPCPTQPRPVDTHLCTGPATTDISRSSGCWWRSRWIPWCRIFTETIAYIKPLPTLKSKSWSALCSSEWISTWRMRGRTHRWTWPQTKKRAVWFSEVSAPLTAQVQNAITPSSISVTSSSSARTVETSTASCARREPGSSKTKMLILRSALSVAAITAWPRLWRPKSAWERVWRPTISPPSTASIKASKTTIRILTLNFLTRQKSCTWSWIKSRIYGLSSPALPTSPTTRPSARALPCLTRN